MNRFIYWLKVRFSTKDSKCKHFCVTCKYFDRCEEDSSILFAGKNEEITEVETDTATVEGEIQSDLRKAS